MNKQLVITHLKKEYRTPQGCSCVIKDLSLNIASGDFICILGPSGCGKSTLLRCIAGFEKYEGVITIDEKSIEKPGTDRIMVFQDYNQLFPWKTVEKNVQYPLKLQGIKDKNILKHKSDEALKLVNLDNCAKYYPHQLSGGMKQRVAIAKALALKPDIILMDEPFAALDAITRRNLQFELLEITKNESCTFIFVTHNIQEAITLGNRIIVMARGGHIIVDRLNNLPKPITPSSKGYGILWDELKEALNNESQN